MANSMRLRLEELTENPTARIPVCLALDISGSMEGSKIRELNAAVESFFQSIRNDEMASISAEIAIVTFGGNVRQVLDFAGIERQHIPRLSASGGTPMGEAVNMSLDMLEQAKRVYSQMGIDYYQPWLVLMTDGESTDNINSAAARCSQLIANRKLTIFPIAIGSDANLSNLRAFSPNLKPLRMEETDLRRFFSWLSKSTSKVIMSNPGDKEAISCGETEFEKLGATWHDVFKNGR
jgi:uncharacterized protein YegL